MWPNLTLRVTGKHRTLVVVSSLSFEVPDSYLPLVPAYEERYLIYVLSWPATRPPRSSTSPRSRCSPACSTTTWA